MSGSPRLPSRTIVRWLSSLPWISRRKALPTFRRWSLEDTRCRTRPPSRTERCPTCWSSTPRGIEGPLSGSWLRIDFPNRTSVSGSPRTLAPSSDRAAGRGVRQGARCREYAKQSSPPRNAGHPVSFPDPKQDGEINLVVAGESSSEGRRYGGGAVAWKFILVAVWRGVVTSLLRQRRLLGRQSAVLNVEVGVEERDAVEMFADLM